MANTPTKRTRMAKQGTGDNPNAWGVWLNESGLDIIDESWGTAEVAVSGDVVLDAQDFTTDEARRFVVIMTGTGGSVTAPAVDKPYLVDNRCSGAVIFKPFAGTGVSIPAGATAFVFSNAAGNTFWASSVASSRPGAVYSLFGQSAEDAAPASAPSGLTTKAQVEAMIFGTSGLPPPTGGAGKFIGSLDGVTYGLYAVYPSIAGNDQKLLGVVSGETQWVKRNGLILISEQIVTTPVASVDFASGLNSTYDEYEIHVYGVVPSSDDAVLWARTSSDGGVTYDSGTSDYLGTSPTSAAQAVLGVGAGNAAGENGVHGVLTLYRPAATGPLHMQFVGTEISGAGAARFRNVGWIRNSSGAKNAVRVLFSTGNIQSGTFRLYGVAK